MPPFQGLRGTGQFDTDHRPTNYRELFTLLEPNGDAPLNALLAMGASEMTDDPEFKNFRDELPDRTMTASAAVAAAAADQTTITLTAADDNRYAVKGAIVINARSSEVMHVTEDTTGTTLKVKRNIGGTAHEIAANDELFIAGFAAAENSGSPTAISFDASVATNYCQIFKTAFGASNTLCSTNLRTGDKMDENQTKALKLHMSDIERAMFFGARHIDGANTAEPTRFTGGLINSLTNVVDVNTDFATYGGSAAGNMSEEGFDALLISSVFKYGSKQKIAFVGDGVANQIQQIGKDRWQPTAVDGAYGVSMTKYSTYAGDLMVHLHPQFRQIPSMKNAMVIVDFPYLAYRYLKDRDTQLHENLQANDADGKKHEYRTECGLELLQDKVHTYVKGWTGRAAA